MLKRYTSFLLLSAGTFSAIYSFKSIAQDFIAPSMVSIPAGQFMMGNEGGDPATMPIHSVSVNSFHMSKYEITVAEFRKFAVATDFSRESTCNDHIDDKGLRGPSFVGTGRWDSHRATYSDYQPVVCISWGDANAYANWLTEKTGINYRLPTETEWEYAAKANTTTLYYWGDDPTGIQACSYGNFADFTGEYVNNRKHNYSNVGWTEHLNCDDGEAYNAIVGLYRPNSFGLHDMLGNVSEMVQSCYDNSGYDVSANQGKEPETCEFYAHRGGNWHYPSQPASTRGRYKREGWNVGADIGFRLVADNFKAHHHQPDKVFEEKLKRAQLAHIAAREALIPAPKSTQITLLQGNEYQLSWLASDDSSISHFDIYVSKSPLAHWYGGFYRNHYEKIKSVTSESLETKVNLPKGGGSFVVVAVSGKQMSLPSNKALIPHAPIVANLPGRFDMRTVAELTNVSLHHFKKTDEKPEAFILSKLNKNFDKGQASATFKVHVKSSGWYQVNYKGRTFHKGEFFKLWQGNQLIGTVDFDPDIDDKVSLRHRIYLEKGEQELQLTVLRDRFDIWSISWLAFTDASES